MKRININKVRRFIIAALLAILAIVLGIGSLFGFYAFVATFILAVFSFYTGAVAACAISIVNSRITIFDIPFILVDENDVDMGENN
jgi:hypothetical protein